MTVNFPGPGELRVFYRVQSLNHSQRLNFQYGTEPTPGDSFANIVVERRGAADTDMATAAAAWGDLIAPLFESGDSEIQRAEVWKYPAQSNNGTFISAQALNDGGSNVAGTKQGGEYIMTFRTEEGGIMRLHFEEVSESAGATQAYGDLPTEYADIVDFVLSVNNWILGRDTSYPIAFIAGYPGQNEAVFRKRFR